MAKAIALSRHYAQSAAQNAHEPLRVAIVTVCALALIAAGQALPLL
jgi:hypothetical protein